MTKLFLVRHGRSTWNAERRIQGKADPPLDEVGRQQARRLAGRLRGDPPIALYASPLQRARDTAEIVAGVLNVPVKIDPRLKEHDVGDISGLTWEQVQKRYPELSRRYERSSEEVSFPGAEDDTSFRERVTAALDEILVQHEEEPICVVTHGGVLGTYLNHLIGLSSNFSPFRFGNASLSIVDVNSTCPRVVLLNDTCHL